MSEADRLSLQKASRLLLLLLLLSSYVNRVVVARGALRSPRFRAATGLSVVVLLVAMASLATYLVSRVRGEGYAEELLFSVSTTSAVLWTAVAFLVAKVLMSSASGMMGMTTAFAVTDRERRLAVDVLELIVVMGVVAAGMFSFTVAALISFGLSSLLPLLTCVVLPSLCTFALLLLAYRVADLLLLRAGLGRGRAPVMLVLVFLLVVLIARWTLKAVPVVAAPVPPEPFTVWSLLFRDVSARWGSQVAAACLPVVVAVVASAYAFVPSSPLEPRPRYVQVPLPRPVAGRWGIHVACAVRSRCTVEAAALSAGLMLYLCGRPPGGPPVVLAAEPVVVGALFHYEMLAPVLSRLEPRLSSVLLYLRIVTSQLLVVALAALPALVLDVVRGTEAGSVGVAVLAVLGSSLLSTCVGIAMPAADDNPVSVFVGTSLALAVLLLVALVTELISLPAVLTGAVAVIVVLAVVLYSIYSIESNREVRHA